MVIRYSILLFVLLGFGCKKPNPETQEPILGNKNYFLVNEGQFLYGTASLDIINPNDLSIQNDVYHSEGFTQSNGQPGLGDVFQSMAKYQDLLFLVLNNSNSIEVVKASNLEKVKTIDGFESPRYMSVVGDFAFVTDLYANKISVLDLKSLSITITIPIKGWTEGIGALNQSVYVCASKEDSLHVIDANSQSKVQSYYIPHSPNQVFKQEDTLWLSCSGNAERKINPAIYRLIENQVPEKIKEFASLDTIPYDLVFSEHTQSYFIMCNNKVYQAQLGDLKNWKLLIDFKGRNMYNLSVLDSNMFVSDAKDFQQRGSLEVFQLKKNQDYIFLKTLPTGIIPQKVYAF